MAVSRTYKPLLDGLGITYPQYLVLLALWEADGRTRGRPSPPGWGWSRAR